MTASGATPNDCKALAEAFPNLKLESDDSAPAICCTQNITGSLPDVTGSTVICRSDRIVAVFQAIDLPSDHQLLHSDLSSNALSGRIPAEFGGLFNLEQLYVCSRFHLTNALQMAVQQPIEWPDPPLAHQPRDPVKLVSRTSAPNAHPLSLVYNNFLNGVVPSFVSKIPSGAIGQNCFSGVENSTAYHRSTVSPQVIAVTVAALVALVLLGLTVYVEIYHGKRAAGPEDGTVMDATVVKESGPDREASVTEATVQDKRKPGRATLPA
ncbi:hypothetical protein HDU96_007478 [Phlyctochytrium bullatum]|nr:hypothetical protein HDU96_007478 [Phlyctochytrium bullatum]